MQLIRRAIALLKTWKMKREIAHNLKINKGLSLTKYFAEQGIDPKRSVGDPAAFPGIAQRLAGFTAAISQYAKDHQTGVEPKDVHIQIGDSISDFMRGKSVNVDPRLNFGMAGSCSPHFAYTARALAPVLAAANLRVQTLTIGCFMGNALLGYQDYAYAQQDAADALKVIRTLWPTARVEVYGMPPVFDPYATHWQGTAREFFKAWVSNDGNAVYIDLLASFGGGFLGLFPRAQMSVDGVHLTPDAVEQFDGLIRYGRSAPPGSVLKV